MVSILEPKFKKRNNGEEKIYVSTPMEILSSEPIYDEYSNEFEKRPFESVCIKFFSGNESVFASNEGNGKKLKENYAMNIFDFQNSEIHKDHPKYDEYSDEEEHFSQSSSTEIFSYDIICDTHE